MQHLSSQAFGTMHQLWKTQELCDVSITVCDKKFLAHKVRLFGRPQFSHFADCAGRLLALPPRHVHQRNVGDGARQRGTPRSGLGRHGVASGVHVQRRH